MLRKHNSVGEGGLTAGLGSRGGRDTYIQRVCALANVASNDCKRTIDAAFINHDKSILNCKY
jgi:hypothetical protein